MAELTAGQIGVEILTAQAQAGRKPLHHAGEPGTVRFASGDQAQSHRMSLVADGDAAELRWMPPHPAEAIGRGREEHPRTHAGAASKLLASCDMRTLYLRNVPEDVVERLERLAAFDSMSVGAVAVRELAEASRRADNPALLGALPDRRVDSATIVANVDAGRAER